MSDERNDEHWSVLLCSEVLNHYLRTSFRPGIGLGIHFIGSSIFCSLFAPEVLLRATERVGTFSSMKKAKCKIYSAHQSLLSKQRNYHHSECIQRKEHRPDIKIRRLIKIL